MMTPPTEITPEPTLEFVLNYDTSCLPNLTPPSEATPEPGEGESLNLVTIPPMEGEFIELESNLLQNPPPNCDIDGIVGFECLLAENDVFTYSSSDFSLTTINLTTSGLNTIAHPAQQNGIFTSTQPSWGKIADDHYRMAFQCGLNSPSASNGCYWDNQTDAYMVIPYTTLQTELQISPNGSRISYLDNLNRLAIYTISTGTTSGVSVVGNGLRPRWSDNNTIYYFSTFPNVSLRSITPSGLYSQTILNSTTHPGLLTYGYDVHLGDVLYWRFTGSEYQLWRYNGSGNTQLLTGTSVSLAEWSPRGGQFVLLVGQPDNTTCIHLYDANNMTAGYKNIQCGQFRTMDWSGGINLFPQQYTCLNPDTNAPDIDNINRCISELAEYGIIAYAGGLTQNWSTQASFARAWTRQELQGIMAGVTSTAKAFYLVKNPTAQFNTQEIDEARMLFRTIMGDFEILRVNNNIGAGLYFTVDNDGDGVGDECINVRSSACVANYADIITFYDNIFINVNQGIQGISEYLMVHEMGHRFNANSDGGGSQGGRSELSLYGRFDDANTDDLYDYGTDKKRLVMGVTITDDNGISYPDWVRGKRGWGTVPHAPFNYSGYLPLSTICLTQTCRDQTEYITDFQQNSFSIGDSNSVATSQDRESEIDEAITDMFLNWVYFKSTNGSHGFKNLTWVYIPEVVSLDCTVAITRTVGCEDNSRPGDARFDRMEAEMIDIFNKRGW